MQCLSGAGPRPKLDYGGQAWPAGGPLGEIGGWMVWNPGFCKLFFDKPYNDRLQGPFRTLDNKNSPNISSIQVLLCV